METLLQGTAKIPNNPPDTEGEAWDQFSFTASKEPTLPILDLGLPASRL
jgi:hypothetical protein